MSRWRRLQKRLDLGNLAASPSRRVRPIHGIYIQLETPRPTQIDTANIGFQSRLTPAENVCHFQICRL